MTNQYYSQGHKLFMLIVRRTQAHNLIATKMLHFYYIIKTTDHRPNLNTTAYNSPI